MTTERQIIEKQKELSLIKDKYIKWLENKWFSKHDVLFGTGKFILKMVEIESNIFALENELEQEPELTAEEWLNKNISLKSHQIREFRGDRLAEILEQYARQKPDLREILTEFSLMINTNLSGDKLITFGDVDE